MATSRLERREKVVGGGFAEPIPTQRSWRQTRSLPGLPLITAGKLQNCNGLDERGKQRREERKNARICYGQWCRALQMARGGVVALSAMSSNSS